MGGSSPIVVQSMTNTDTADVMSTVNQTMALPQAGSEVVRVSGALLPLRILKTKCIRIG